MIARRVGEVLFESQVALGSLDRGMAERHLDLFELRPALVREPRIGATKSWGARFGNPSAAVYFLKTDQMLWCNSASTERR